MTQQTPTSPVSPPAPQVAPTASVPLYSAPVQQPAVPPVIRPEGPSVGTIILGTLLSLLGIVTIAFGINLATNFLPAIDIDIPQLIAYLLAGTGIVLTLIALEWGITTAIKRRRTQAQLDTTSERSFEATSEASASHESTDHDTK